MNTGPGSRSAPSPLAPTPLRHLLPAGLRRRSDLSRPRSSYMSSTKPKPLVPTATCAAGASVDVYQVQLPVYAEFRYVVMDDQFRDVSVPKAS